MKISQAIVIGALLGTMSINEVVNAIEVQAHQESQQSIL
jgi:hypothetical protein